MIDSLYQDIKNTTKFISAPLSNIVCKLCEEIGELVQSCNKIIGVKRHKLKKDQLREEIVEECADSLCNLFSLAASQDISLNEIVEKAIKKNEKWKERFDK